jgi:hypothetical protein
MKRVSTLTTTNRISYAFTREEVMAALINHGEIPLPPANDHRARSEFTLCSTGAEFVVIYTEVKGAPESEPGD